MEVEITDISKVIYEDGKEYAVGSLVFPTIENAVQLVKDLSIMLESPDFDKRCYEFFRTATDNICCSCKH